MERQYIGRYRLVGRLGTGGMGTVLRAVDEVRQREVAIKLPNDLDARTIALLQQECNILAQLEHHNIVQMLGSGSDSDPTLPFYIVMEFVDGETLEDLLRQQNGPLEWRRALQIGLGIAEALAYAHRQPQRVIHRDIKPGNILIRRSDQMVKVTDFGIAAVLAERAAQTAVGTLAYMAPEQGNGQGVDERTDLYSLGAVLYEMLTGHRPPQLASAPARPPGAWLDPEVVSPDIRARIDRLVMGLLRHDREQRQPQRASNVADELRALLEGRPSPLMTHRPTTTRSPVPADVTQRAGRPPAITYPLPPQRLTAPPSTYYPPQGPVPYQAAPAPYPPQYAPYPQPAPKLIIQPPAAQPGLPPARQQPAGPQSIGIPRPKNRPAAMALVLALLALTLTVILFIGTNSIAALHAFHWPPPLRFTLRRSGTPFTTEVSGLPVALLLLAGVPALFAVVLGRVARTRVLRSGGIAPGGMIAFFARWIGYFCLIALFVMLIVAAR
jgi:serine/threonine protein kinase